MAAPIAAGQEAAGGYTFSRARELAFAGKQHRQEALELLKQRLVQSPGDNDARTIYGTVLSWEGQYDEARRQLTQVLDNHPHHSDALPALINVELWSDHPARAEELAADGLEHSPKDTALMLQLARAQRNQGHYRESLHTLDEVLKLEPTNAQALRWRRALTVESWKWEAEFSHASDFLSRHQGTQHEDSLQLRGPTPIGSLIGRVSRAARFGISSYQIEADMYPHLRPGTYMYVNVGTSPDQELYPKYRLGADLYQSIGHGWELSGGYRHLQFSTGTNIYTWAAAKYLGDWLFTGRMYLTPDDLGVSKTVQVGARRFFGSEGLHDYVEVRYSHGSSLALAQTTLDIIGQNSTRVTVEGDKTLGHWALNLKGGAGSEDLPFGKRNRYTAQGSVYYRF
ncbi:MAG TPA: YaiO family outer membrane beta-barrel protein [Terriglobales bacterium]|nr:YaiO family outer membrane beta-barrel protein [Terriglobales bacterium]